MEDYILTSFSSGELTPKGMGRIDIPAYISGCSKLRRFIVLPQGGATRMPGTKMLATLQADTIFVEFVGNDDIGYLLAFSDLRLDIYLNGVNTYSNITTIWSKTDILEMQYETIGDIMYIVHPDNKPYTLTYVSGTSFTLDVYTHNTTDWPTEWDASDLDTTVGNYPSGVATYEGRLLFSGSNNFPDHMWGSRVKIHDEFSERFDNEGGASTELTSVDAFEIAITDMKGPKIKWMIGARGVFVGTDRGVYSVSDENNLLSPVSLITAKRNSSYPASKIPGVLLGGELFYVQAGLRKVRMAIYNQEQDMYLTPDITSAAEHITYGNIKSLAVQTLPETLLWVILESGELLTFSYNQENKITAWSKHETEGDYKSVAVIKKDDIEIVYLNVERNSVEYLEEVYPIDFEENEYVFLDSAKTVTFGNAQNITTLQWVLGDIKVNLTGHGYSIGDYVKMMGTGIGYIDYVVFQVGFIDANSFYLLDEDNGSTPDIDSFSDVSVGTVQEARKVITGLNHLNGEDVYVMTGPTTVGEYTVAGNEITVEDRRTTFTVGYNYNSDIIPMNIGIKKNKKKRPVKVYLEVFKTIAGKVGKDEDNLDNFNIPKTIVMDQPQDTYTGVISAPSRSGNSYEGKIMVRQDLPLPMTILSLMIDLEVE